MTVNRRHLLQASGAVVAGLVAGLVAGAGAGSGATPGNAGFDINMAFAEVLTDIGAAPDDAGGGAPFPGEGAIVRSHLRIGAAMSIAAMSIVAMSIAAMGAAVGAAQSGARAPARRRI